MPHHVLEVLSHVPSSRLMIGPDLPESTESEIGKILNLDIPDSDKRTIMSGTGDRLLGGA